MKRWYKLIARLAVMVIVLSALAGCNVLGFQSWTWHQKLTISVMTPDGLKVASAVSAVSIYKSPEWWGMGDSRGSITSSTSGEAVVLELTKDRFLFALLRGPYEPRAESVFFPDPEKPRLWEQLEPLYDWLVSLRETREVPRKEYPMLVTFGDVNVPSSIKLVDPLNLAATFGSGYALSKVELSITDDNVSRENTRRVLPWLCTYMKDGIRLSGKKGAISDNLLANNLDAAVFFHRRCGWFD